VDVLDAEARESSIKLRLGAAEVHAHALLRNADKSKISSQEPVSINYPDTASAAGLLNFLGQDGLVVRRDARSSPSTRMTRCSRGIGSRSAVRCFDLAKLTWLNEQNLTSSPTSSSPTRSSAGA